MSDFADLAAVILAEQGEAVNYQAGTAAPVVRQAVVTRHGFGPAPAGWPEDLFPYAAKHALVRFAAAGTTEPGSADTIGLDGLAYEVRQVFREPRTGPAPLWWLCLCACGQRGKY